MPSLCAFEGCKGRKHRFKIPAAHLRRNKWLKIIRTHRGDQNWVPSKDSFVCEKHFGRSEIRNYGARCRLSDTAIPHPHVSTDYDSVEVQNLVSNGKESSVKTFSVRGPEIYMEMYLAAYYFYLASQRRRRIASTIRIDGDDTISLVAVKPDDSTPNASTVTPNCPPTAAKCRDQLQGRKLIIEDQGTTNSAPPKRPYIVGDHDYTRKVSPRIDRTQRTSSWLNARVKLKSSVSERRSGQYIIGL